MIQYAIKSISTIGSEGSDAFITEVDAKSRTVEGYFSIFGNVDSDGDMIMPGAFTKTIKESGHRVKHLYQHDVRYPVAKPIITEDTRGLKFRSTISDTSIGRDLIKLYQDGVIDEHSIGFNTIKQQKKSNYKELTELRLWEGSSVTWGANSLSIGGPAKSMTKEAAIDRMDAIYKAIRNGRYENDELFEQLDIYHQQLKQFILDLSAHTPAVEETQEPDKAKEADNEMINKSLTSLIDLFK